MGRLSAALHSMPSRQLSPLVVAFVVFLLAALVSAGVIWKLAEEERQSMRGHASLEAANHAHALERSIDRSLSATYALAVLVREGSGGIHNFDAVASQMLPLYPGAMSLQLAPRGIVRQIVPLAGNEKAIGLDLLKDPARNPAAFLARDTGQLTLDGPFQLVQGGTGAVGRLAVFLDSAKGPDFWGFVTVVIRVPDAHESIRLMGLSKLGLAYQLWRNDLITKQKQIIAAFPSAELIDPVQEIVHVPNATWTLGVAPVKGWREDPLELLLEAALGLFLSVLLGYAAKLLIELRAHKRGLEALVEQRTAEVKAREADLNRAQSIARVGSWVFDLPERTIRWSVEASRIFGGRTGEPFDHDAFLKRVHPQDRDAVERAWQEALVGKPLDLEHRVGVGAETRWVHARADPEFAADGTPWRIVGSVQDITERKRAEESLRELNRTLKALGESNAISAAVIENAAEAVMVIDDKLQIESVNPAFERITGYPAAQAVGRTPRILFSGKHDDEFFRRLHELVDEEGHWHGEIWNRRRSGELYPQETSINILRDAQGRISHYASVFSDNTARNQMEARLRELSAVDALTGIANRRTFDEALARDWARAMREGRPLSLLMVDVDHFKGYNDRNGHPEGDACLQQIATAIAGVVTRASDLAARYGGEEFAVILPNTDAAGAATVAEKIRANVAALALPHGASAAAAFVTVSVGAATLIPLKALPAADLIAAADRALYQAKREGRNRVVVSPPAGAANVTVASGAT